MTWLTNIGAQLRTIWNYRREPEYARRLAELYWHVLLACAAFVVVGFALYGALKFFAVTAPPEGSVVLSPGDSATILDRTELQAIIDAFAVRKARYESLKASPPSIADPSR